MLLKTSVVVVDNMTTGLLNGFELRNADKRGSDGGRASEDIDQLVISAFS